MLDFEIPDPNVLHSEETYVMDPNASSIWVEVAGISLWIRHDGATVKVEVYPKYDEIDDEPLEELSCRFKDVSYSDEALEQLWDEFGNDVGCDDDGITDAPFLHFPAGINREDIWHWFDERHSKGVAWLLNERGSDDTDDHS